MNEDTPQEEGTRQGDSPRGVDSQKADIHQEAGMVDKSHRNGMDKAVVDTVEADIHVEEGMHRIHDREDDDVLQHIPSDLKTDLCLLYHCYSACPFLQAR